jgi:hypothetical protein
VFIREIRGVIFIHGVPQAHVVSSVNNLTQRRRGAEKSKDFHSFAGALRRMLSPLKM